MKAALRFTVETRNGISFLKSAFTTPPFKLADITEDRQQPRLSLMMMSSSPGILDEDDYTILIKLSTGTVVSLETQSFQRLFHMKKGAVQHFELQMEKDSAFCFLPHPVVPHESSVFKAKNRLYLSRGSSLLWGEILTCGRKMNGEIFRFSSYHTLTEIFMEGKLVVRENLFVEPSQLDPRQVGQLEGFTHQASLIFINRGADIQILSGLVDACLQKEKGIMFGMSATTVNGFVVRILGNKAEQLFTMLKNLKVILPWEQFQCISNADLNIPSSAHAK